MATDREIADLVGPEALARGLAYARGGRVLETRWYGQGDHLFGRVAGSRRDPYSVNVVFEGRVPKSGMCSCPMYADCKHVAALLVIAREQGATRTSWRDELAELLATEDPEPSTEATGLGLLFALVAEGHHVGRTPRLGLRPLLRSGTGRWVATGANWRDLNGLAGWPRTTSRRQVDALLELHSLCTAHLSWERYETWAHPDRVGDIFWTVLEQLRAAGVVLLTGGRERQEVSITEQPVEPGLDLRRSDGDLLLEPRWATGEDGPSIDPHCFGSLGNPVHGLYHWTPPEGRDQLAFSRSGREFVSKDAVINLARLAAPVPRSTVELLQGGQPIEVPRADVDEFEARSLPRLRRRVRVSGVDGDEVPSEPEPPTLWLVVDFDADLDAHLWWGWRYGQRAEEPPQPDELYPLFPVPGDQLERDPVAEERIIDTVADHSAQLARLWSRHRREGLPAEELVLTGIRAIDFADTELRLLQTSEEVAVHLLSRVPEFTETPADEVTVEFAPTETDDPDWLDLAIVVRVQGEMVPFLDVFEALVAGKDRLVLPSGRWFSLAGEMFARMRDLIDEARELQDRPSAEVRVNRHQVGWWEELAELGEVRTETAWQRSVAGLRGEVAESLPLAEGFRAELRPYQQQGYDWLSFLHDAGLGGVLADDMGLGKTVQALALITARSPAERGAGPFLVVAPTSVVGNWAAETARFAPGLTVATITETVRRRGTPLADLAAGADLVITSYALFRLEFADYDTLEWSGLLLDEAQSVKNHQSVGYACARDLAVPFRLAITGTPMENNLTELWAIFTLVAPGLFGDLRQFTEQYRRPIEAGDDETLDRLRRRIRPLMLRRRKEDVVLDLPPKQEQVIRVELNSRHRRAYDVLLHRERQKILGLLDDLQQNRITIFSSLTKLRQASLDASLLDDSLTGVATKLEVLFELLDDALAEGHTVVVFSQFTSFLARVRERLDARGVEHCYLDGRTRHRDRVIARFRTGEVPVFLISLKAGGVGLNLTEADYCILLDPWWNPAAEAQAVDRTHRIGQRRTVMVYRLVSADTIEDKVMKLKDAKSRLFADVIDGGGAGGGAVTADDIRALLS